MEDIEEYLSLPEDPELAFVEYVRRRQVDMSQALEGVAPDTNWACVLDCRMVFLNKVMAFHDAYAFSFLSEFDLTRDTKDFPNAFDKFADHLQRVSTEISVRHARRLRPISTIITLPDEIRKHIHNLIEKVRLAIVPLNLRPEKKESLLTKLNALSEEVDRERSKTEALTAFVLELASAGGQAAMELGPIREMADSITNQIGKAKELAERLGLPSPGQRKPEEVPIKQLPKPRDESIESILKQVEGEIPSEQAAGGSGHVNGLA